MQKKLKEEEIKFCECLHDPVALIENLIPLDVKIEKPANNPSNWNIDTPCIKIRQYQNMFLSWEYMLADDDRLSPQENFENRRKVGTNYLFCGRKIGKSFIGLDCDNLCSLIINDNYETCFASFDFLHLRTRMEFVCRYVEDHPFLKIFHLRNRKKSVNRGNYWISTENGSQIYSINENVKGKNVGAGYHQVHFQRFLYEENSYETEQGYSKRIDSSGELGFIERLSGIPSFHKSSPAAKIFGDSEKRKFLVRLPEYVSPLWNEKARKQRAKEYGGEETIGYRVNILAEIVQDAHSVYDMEKVRANFNENKLIKHFEIGKQSYSDFKNIIIVDNLKNSDKCYVNADIGDSGAPTEIAIIFEVKQKYLYRFNITLNGLDHKEETEIFLWLFNKLKNVFINLDVTDGKGRAIYRDLARVINPKYLGWVHFAEKVVVGFEKDDDGNIVCDSKGKLIEKLEYVAEFSIQHLKELFYDKKFDLAMDDKLDRQIDGIVQVSSGNRIVFDSVCEDHLHQAFQVFAISEFKNKFTNPQQTKSKYSAGVFG